MKILLLYKGYPRISHGYQSNEAVELSKNHQIMIISYDWELFTKEDNHLPFTYNHPVKEIKNIIKFEPDIIHSHYLDTFDVCVKLSETLKIPFTIKSHSFDILNNDFYTPKKNIKGFILLSKKIKERFPNKIISYYSVMENKTYYDEIMLFNKIHNNPVNFLTVQPEKMPLEYKKHQWLIYTACPEKKNVGNPLMVAEAQASGVGVIMYKLRTSLDDYVTDNGYLYENDEQVLQIISNNFNEEKRNNSIEIAKNRYNIKDKIKIIEDIWKDHIL